MESRRSSLKNIKGLHMVHLNLQSLNNKIDLVRTQIAECGPQIFTVSETWLKDGLPDHLYDVPGYDLVRLDRTWETSCGKVKNGGGVGMFIRKDIKYCAHKYENLNLSSKELECLWVLIEHPNMKKMVVGSVYRPPSGSSHKFADLMIDRANQILSTAMNIEIFILGDFNINYLQHNSDSRKHLKFFERSTGLTQLITVPTRQGSINSFFANIGPTLAASFSMPWASDDPVADCKMDSIIVNEEDVLQVIRDIDVAKLSAVDHLSSRVLKDAFLTLIPKLTYMYNSLAAKT